LYSPAGAFVAVGSTHVEQELRQVEIFLFAGDAIELDQAHLGDLMTGPDRALARSERATSKSAVLMATSSSVRLPVAW
jgi:hypothetical protein